MWTAVFSRLSIIWTTPSAESVRNYRLLRPGGYYSDGMAAPINFGTGKTEAQWLFGQAFTELMQEAGFSGPKRKSFPDGELSGYFGDGSSGLTIGF